MIQYSLLPTNKIVKGYTRSIIYDLKNYKYYFIPSKLALLLEEYRTFNIELWKKHFPLFETSLLESYLNYLLNFQLIIPIDNTFKFEELKLTPPSHKFTNTILRTRKDIDDIITSKIINAGIKHLHLIITEKISHSHLVSTCIKLKQFVSIEFYCASTSTEQELISLSNEFPNIRKLFIFNRDKNRKIETSHPEMGETYLIKDRIDKISCGYISQEYFSTNMEMFNYSHSCNTCLGGKLSIDENNQIKNCLFLKKTFGNILNTNIINLLHNKEFTSSWFICKDQIGVCSDCEYRYMCSDCRAFIEDSRIQTSKPLKCSYNPYIVKWEEDEDYQPSKHFGEYTNDGKFKLNETKIKNKIQELWEK